MPVCCFRVLIGDRGHSTGAAIAVDGQFLRLISPRRALTLLWLVEGAATSRPLVDSASCRCQKDHGGWLMEPEQLSRASKFAPGMLGSGRRLCDGVARPGSRLFGLLRPPISHRRCHDSLLGRLLVNGYSSAKTPECHGESIERQAFADTGLVVLLCTTLLLPLHDEFFVVRFVIVLCVFGATFLRRVPSHLRWFPLGLFLFTVTNVLLSAILSLVLDGSAALDPVQHEALRFTYYSLFVATAIRLRAPFSVLLGVSKTLLLLHLAVQLVQLTNAEAINPWIEEHYARNTVHLGLAALSWPDFRSGSIYLNPNVYVLFPVIILSVLLQGRTQSTVRRFWLWVFLCVLSVILTGSRMGLILTLTVLAAAWARLGRVSRRQPAALVGVGLSAVFAAVVAPSLANVADRGRSFDISGALSDSLDVKFELLLESLLQAHPLRLLVGALASPSGSSQDMEAAHIIISFGLMGVVWYIGLLGFLLIANRERLRFLSMAIVLVIVLTSFAASTVLNIVIFPFVLIVLLVEWHKRQQVSEVLVSTPRLESRPEFHNGRPKWPRRSADAQVEYSMASGPPDIAGSSQKAVD